MTSEILRKGIDIAKKAVSLNSGGLLVYSAVISEYDDPPVVSCRQPEGVEFVCFTDRAIENSGPWKIVRVDRETMDARAQAKIYKMFPHVLFRDNETSIWIDGSFEITGDMKELAENALQYGRGMAVFAHPARKSVYAEALACKRLKKEDAGCINRQMARYQAAGFLKKKGLILGGVLIRKHNNRDVIKVMESWWQEVNQFTMRDQLSFNFVAWRDGLKVEILKESIHDNQYLKWMAHKHPITPLNMDLSYQIWKYSYRVMGVIKRTLRGHLRP